ncbi:MAG: hypothetical protein H0W76_08285 [Pyrinomonadaceae bacterium]|nr:hypothetical protein [Pyrinomonadaceae bacterium]
MLDLSPDTTLAPVVPLPCTRAETRRLLKTIAALAAEYPHYAASIARMSAAIRDDARRTTAQTRDAVLFSLETHAATVEEFTADTGLPIEDIETALATLQAEGLVEVRATGDDTQSYYFLATAPAY